MNAYIGMVFLMSRQVHDILDRINNSNDYMKDLEDKIKFKANRRGWEADAPKDLAWISRDTLDAADSTHNHSVGGELYLSIGLSEISADDAYRLGLWLVTNFFDSVKEGRSYESV